MRLKEERKKRTPGGRGSGIGASLSCSLLTRRACRCCSIRDAIHLTTMRVGLLASPNIWTVGWGEQVGEQTEKVGNQVIALPPPQKKHCSHRMVYPPAQLHPSE